MTDKFSGVSADWLFWVAFWQVQNSNKSTYLMNINFLKQFHRSKMSFVWLFNLTSWIINCMRSILDFVLSLTPVLLYYWLTLHQRSLCLMFHSTAQLKVISIFLLQKHSILKNLSNSMVINSVFCHVFMCVSHGVLFTQSCGVIRLKSQL